jgi:hypothetical protein
VAKFRKLRKREGRKAPAAAPRVRHQPPARLSVVLEPVEPERDADAVAELARDDLAGVIGEGRDWHGSDDR